MFYQESGKANTLGLVISYLFCLGVAMGLGYVYSIAIFFIPIVYLNFLLTLGFGLILGLMCRFFVRISHNRSKKSQIIQAAIIGIMATYFQWTAYILFIYNGSVAPPAEYLANLDWIVIPKNFFAAIAKINRVGAWSIFGVTFRGFSLALVWIMETFIIIVLPVVAIRKTPIYPYSEKLSKWYPKFTLFKDFESLSGSKKLMDDLAANPLVALQGLGKGSGTRHTKVHLFYFKDEDRQYLTFERIFIDGNGRGKRNGSVVINNLAIDSNAAIAIMAKFEHKREKIEII